MCEGQRNPAESPERCQGETHGTEALTQQGKEGRRTRNFNKQQASSPQGACGSWGGAPRGLRAHRSTVGVTVTSRLVEGQGRWGDRVEAGDGNQEEGQAGEPGSSRACAGLTLRGGLLGSQRPRCDPTVARN